MNLPGRASDTSGSNPWGQLVARMRPHSTSIFGTTSAAAARCGAINLGQGFPEDDGPDVLKDLAVEAIRDGSGNQYPPAHGLPVLREAVAAHQEQWYGLTVDPDNEVVVTTGASEALAASVLAFCSAGDEVVVMEPYFDLYAAIVALAGARLVTVPLTTKVGASGRRFALDQARWDSAVTDRTRLIILNSPHNPTGMVLPLEDLHAIADSATRSDVVVVSDEAYEHLVYPPARHHPIATIDGMAERTVTIGSGGKSFSFTGWKVGWASGPRHLIGPVRVVRQHLSYVSGGPFQAALAHGLGLPRSYFTDFADELAARRDFLGAGLSALGLDVFSADGTYFLTTDLSPLGVQDASAWCEALPQQAGVAAIPLAALARDRDAYSTLVRWTFCKAEASLAEAIDRLSRTDLAAIGR